MRRSVKVGLVGAAAVAGFGLAAAVPAIAAPTPAKSSAQLLQLCITINPSSPICIRI